MFPNYPELIRFHLQQHGGCEIQDIYKLLLQSILGPEHLLRDPVAAKERLRLEWEAQTATDGEPLFEPISLDGQIVRANLRPLKARGLHWLDLWNAFLRSAQPSQADKAVFITVWQQSLAWLEESSLFTEKNIMQFDEKMRIIGYPVMHHSASYLHHNRPAYRVIRQAFLPMPE
jgi:hypothetical protein